MCSDSSVCLYVRVVCCLNQGGLLSSVGVLWVSSLAPAADQQLPPAFSPWRSWHSPPAPAYSLLGRLTGWSLWRKITYVMESGSDSGHVFYTSCFCIGRVGKRGIKPPGLFSIELEATVCKVKLSYAHLLSETLVLLCGFSQSDQSHRVSLFLISTVLFFFRTSDVHVHFSWPYMQTSCKKINSEGQLPPVNLGSRFDIYSVCVCVCVFKMKIGST